MENHKESTSREPEEYKRIQRRKLEEKPEDIITTEKGVRKITGPQYQAEVTKESGPTIARDFYSQPWLKEEGSMSEWLLANMNITGTMQYDSLEMGPAEEARAHFKALLGVRFLQEYAKEYRGKEYLNSREYQTDQLLVYSTFILRHQFLGVIIAFPRHQESKMELEREEEERKKVEEEKEKETRGGKEKWRMDERKKARTIKRVWRMSEEERKAHLQNSEKLTGLRAELMERLRETYRVNHEEEDLHMQKIVLRLQRLITLGHYLKARTNSKSRNKEEARRGEADLCAMNPTMEEVITEEKRLQDENLKPDPTYPAVWIAGEVAHQYENISETRAVSAIAKNTRAEVDCAMREDNYLENMRELKLMKKFVCDTLLPKGERRGDRFEPIWPNLKDLKDFLHPARVKDRILLAMEYEKTFGSSNK